MPLIDPPRVRQYDLPTSSPLDFGSFAEGGLRAEVMLRLRVDHLVYIRGFPISTGSLIRFLSHFGRPLPNYASTLIPADVAPENFINRVCFKNERAEFGFQAEGPLPIHTARSWRMPPPALFSMLMVNKGDQRPGYSGASRVLRFRDALRWLKESQGSAYSDIISQLSNLRIALPAKKVPEPPPLAPIMFSVGSPDECDLGVRFRADIDDIAAPQLQASRWTDSIAHLVDAVSNCGGLFEFQMQPGDLLVLDNRRFGHGRANAERIQSDGFVNPREIWSTTID
jgi:hypothetical protein